ncbi:MAG: AMP-binding protein, partial [Pyrinomonadaceae bacterium]
VRMVLIGGERASEERLGAWNRVASERASLVNVYGLTEVTITSLIERMESGSSSSSGEGEEGRRLRLPLGRPVANTSVYVLDEHGEPVPVGVRGELYIGGEGVGRGYLGRAEQTAERFIPDRFSEEEGGRLYRTGDICRYLRDGRVEYLGRRDEQVKVRGYRVELGEVEARLMEHEGVREAVVMAREDVAGDKRLVAYVVSQSQSAPISAAVSLPDTVKGREQRVELLPSYGEYSIYDELLYYAMTRDEIRNERYKAAISRLVKDKVVVDVGMDGDVTLSQLCLEAGAAKVYSIEVREESYRQAQASIERAGLQERIQLIHGAAGEVELPEQADVCVSELIGTIGSAEGVATIINDARRLVKPNGAIIPSRCVTRMAAVSLPDALAVSPKLTEVGAYYAEKVFGAVGHRFDLRVCVRNFPGSHIISSEETFEELDFSRSLPVEQKREARLRIERDGLMDGFLLWINLYADEEEKIDSLRDECSWLPLYAPVFDGGVAVSEGDVLEIECSSALSDNGLNPDYRIKGKLRRQVNGEEIEFDWVSPHHQAGYKESAFYQVLFDEESAQEATAGDDDGWTDGAALTDRDLRSYLQRHLPEYMVPAAYVFLDEFPLTQSGKVDKRALPAPDLSRTMGDQPYQAPRTPVEAILAGIWGELLKIERVGINDNFFTLGGHSLLAMQLLSRVREAFQVELPLRAIFESPTVVGMATGIAQSLAGQLDDAAAGQVLSKLESLSDDQAQLLLDS